MKQPKQIKCRKCEYEWWTKSQLERVNCPSCGHINQNKEVTKK